jgi:DNA primase
METLGLIGKRSNNDGYYDKFRNRIMYPIIDTRSRVIGFGGRVLDETMPKYLNSKETPIFNKGNHIYGLNLLNKFSDRKRIILVEGYMDVIALFNNKINYGVASLGTALTENQAKLLKRYGENVYICFDSDLAGINATNKAIEILLKEEINPKIITLPGYKDPDDYLRGEGLEKFESRINQALTQVDFKIHINKQKYNINEAEGKIKFTIEIAKVIKALKSPIEKDVYIDKISKEIGISKEAIEKEVFGKSIRKNNNQNYKNQFQKNKKDPRESIYPVRTTLISGNLRAEIDLIKLMIFSKEYYEVIISKIKLDEFKNFECRQILNMINELYLEDENIDEDLLYSNIKNLPNINLELINTISKKRINFLPENVEQMIEDLINTLNISKIELQRDNIKKEIEKLEKQQDKNSKEEEKLIKLCMELTNLNKELNLSRLEDGR